VLHEIYTSGQNGNRLSKIKWATRTMFSHLGLRMRLQATELLASLTYQLKITKDQPTTHPNITETLSSPIPDNASISSGSSSAGGACSYNSKTSCSRLVIVYALSSTSASYVSMVFSRCTITLIWVSTTSRARSIYWRA
jgi:hypothetical protein